MAAGYQFHVITQFSILHVQINTISICIFITTLLKAGIVLLSCSPNQLNYMYNEVPQSYSGPPSNLTLGQHQKGLTAHLNTTVQQLITSFRQTFKKNFSGCHLRKLSVTTKQNNPRCIWYIQLVLDEICLSGMHELKSRQGPLNCLLEQETQLSTGWFQEQFRDKFNIKKSTCCQ